MTTMLFPLLLLAAGPDAASHVKAERAFLAALPADPDDAPREDALDAAKVARLVALNPGRGVDVRAALMVGELCRAKAQRAQALLTLANTAKALPEPTLAALTSFYTGPDYARIDALDRQGQRSAAEQAELTALIARYRLADLQAAMKTETEKLWNDGGFFQELERCDAREAAAFTARGLERD